MSSLSDRIKEWARSMGYDGDISQSLNKICNPSTAFIWEQLITNIKPKQEVAYIKGNIIVNRLRQKPLTEQDAFNYHVKEIDLLLKKKTLELRISKLEEAIKEKGSLIDDVLKKNKRTYVAIDNIKTKIKEDCEKKFLLEHKCKMLEDDLNLAEEVLTLAQNLTPVELDETANENDITETLQKCAEKLYTLSQEFLLTATISEVKNHSLLIKTNTSRSFSCKPAVSSGYLNESSVDFKVRRENKENMFSQNVLLTGNVDESPARKLSLDDSLGLLSNPSLESPDEFDGFFLSTANRSQRKCSLISTLFDRSNTSLNSFRDPIDYTILEKLQDNPNVKDTLRNLLHQNNRQLIIKCCQRVHEHLLNEINKKFESYNKTDKSFPNQDNLNGLYFIHIKSELEREKHQNIVRRLQEKLQRQKNDTSVLLSSKSKSDDVQKQQLESQLEKVFLVASMDFLRQKIESLKKAEVSDELDQVSKKLEEIKEEILLKSDHVRVIIGNIHKILEEIKSNREETSSCVRSINPYIFNLPLASCLKEKLNSREIKVFEEFPFEFNKKFMNNDLKYYRHISHTTVPPYIDVDSKNLTMITTLMDTPFGPAESVLLKMLQSRIKLNMLRSFPTSATEIAKLSHTYTTAELEEHEKYIKDVENKLTFMLNASSIKELLSAPSVMPVVADLWRNMPFKNFISENRLVEGHNYNYFQKLFDNICNSL